MSAPGNVRAAEATRDTWETPAALFDLLNAEFRFTLDAAADESNRKCERWLEGPHQDEAFPWCGCGLCADWMEHTVWLNPPYGKGIEEWIWKCKNASERGAVVVALLPANTDTQWFHRLWFTTGELRFLTGRVQFVGTTSSNPGGSVVAVFRPGGPRVALWDWKS